MKYEKNVHLWNSAKFDVHKRKSKISTNIKTSNTKIKVNQSNNNQFITKIYGIYENRQESMKIKEIYERLRRSEKMRKSTNIYEHPRKSMKTCENLVRVHWLLFTERGCKNKKETQNMFRISVQGDSKNAPEWAQSAPNFIPEVTPKCPQSDLRVTSEWPQKWTLSYPQSNP